MRYVKTDLGFATADADLEKLVYDGSDLSIEVLDWKERRVTHKFADVLAFRWSDGDDGSEARDDETYEVRESPWLAREAEAARVDVRDYVHLRLGFNCNVLEVLARGARTT